MYVNEIIATYINYIIIHQLKNKQQQKLYLLKLYTINTLFATFKFRQKRIKKKKL